MMQGSNQNEQQWQHICCIQVELIYIYIYIYFVWHILIFYRLNMMNKLYLMAAFSCYIIYSAYFEYTTQTVKYVSIFLSVHPLQHWCQLLESSYQLCACAVVCVVSVCMNSHGHCCCSGWIVIFFWKWCRCFLLSAASGPRHPERSSGS